MKKLLHLFSFAALCLLVQCKSSRLLTSVPAGAQIQATITHEGFINCYENGLAVNGQPLWCEASAVVFDGRRIIFANDKDMPDARSSIFSWPFSKGFADTALAPVYFNDPILKNGKKFEDFAITPNGKTVFLSTAFDRVKPETTEWNSYNTIFYWLAGEENKPLVLSYNNTDSTSISVRDKISKALVSSAFPNGMPYFKVEGLAAAGNTLYFGIREEGKKFDDFSYKVKILTASYSRHNGRITLNERFNILSDIDITSINPYLQQPLGLSSIEYDRFHKRFLILTSYENKEKFGAYLWTATKNDLAHNRMTLVRDTSGNPLAFTHKAEDIAIISKNKVIIINDDDKVATIVAGKVRKPNQAAYSIVEFK